LCYGGRRLSSLGHGRLRRAAEALGLIVVDAFRVALLFEGIADHASGNRSGRTSAAAGDWPVWSFFSITTGVAQPAREASASAKQSLPLIVPPYFAVAAGAG